MAARGLLALAAAALVAALASSSTATALEVKTTETLVKLRGSPATYTTYFVEVTTSETSTYDEVSIVDDANLVLPSFVSYFDLPARGKNGDASGGSNETDAAAEDEASRRQQQQEGSEEEDASEAVLLVDGVDLHWLQEQVDLLSRFESSLSLDSVLHRGGILPPRG